VNVPGRVLGLDLDRVRTAIREGQIGDGDAVAVADVKDVIAPGVAVPTPATERDLGRVTAGAADREVLLCLKDNDPGKLVMTVGEENRVARLSTFDGCEQFVHSRDADYFTVGQRKGRSSGEPRRDIHRRRQPGGNK